MTDVIELSNSFLALRLRLQGAAVLALNDCRRVSRPLLRPAPSPDASVGECSLFPMLPLANRVEGNGFMREGRRYQLPSSPMDERFFLHGDGWIRPWTLVERQASTVCLALESNVPGLYHYHAYLHYGLMENVFYATLQLTHLAETPFPYGLGFHPFFVKTPATELQFECGGYWPERECHLPGKWRSELPNALDFQLPRNPGDIWINNAFSDWPGSARLYDDIEGHSLTLYSDAEYLMVYQPQGKQAVPFICLEPQTHPVNAHNHPQLPGLKLLRRGETCTINMRLVSEAAGSR
ncbi:MULTISPECIES: aldose 1-epimerase [unclassified Brenneria]|uniref:aldose 1-epimerase n=1 Tax=unclassified Brenneria TaxID=2634434 RepID=UPI0029C15C7C|nr:MULTISPECIES: aldose 1-epimerase [unclassified Brenneria]MDX5629614.1 aldose 1-epimerase [Brenneria sp. L3-3Z]MDX5696760.1 aldose 1-epimerase [Brenneria sp. L4-2C]